MDYNNKMNEYIATHIDAEPAHLAKLRRDTYVQLLYPQMVSGHWQGRLLAMISKIIKPDRILEIGTFTGYSAQCLAEGLSETGRITTIEANDELEDFIREHLNESPVGHKIDLHIGDACTIAQQLNGPFDLIFIDANKREYPKYFEIAKQKISPNGYILADNILWDGKVADPNANDSQTVGVKQFNDMVFADSTFEKVIIALRDGLVLLRKK